MSTSEIETEILEITKEKAQKKGEDQQKYFSRLIAATSQYEDEEFKTVFSEAAQLWINNAVAAENDEEEIANFQDAKAVADDEDEDTEDEEESEPEEDEDTDEDEESTEEDDDQEEDDEDRVSAKSNSEDDTGDDETSSKAGDDEEEESTEDEEDEPKEDEDVEEKDGETEDEEEDETVKEVDEDEVAEVQPRRRGRPPSKDKVAAKPAAPKGKPGRPKKVVEEEKPVKKMAKKVEKPVKATKPARSDDGEGRKFNASSYIIKRLLKNPDLTVFDLQEGLEKRGSHMSPQAISSTRSNTRTVRKLAVELGWREPKA